MVVCICASPWRGLSLAQRKLKARLGDGGPSDCLAASLCQLGPRVGLSLRSFRCLTGLMVQLFEHPKLFYQEQRSSAQVMHLTPCVPSLAEPRWGLSPDRAHGEMLG